ncbi:MAG: biosynthetic-type acetolactate synthase large subunit [Sumerlaeia bacterium]
MTGADTIIQVLADEGVDVIFGYSGGAILPTYDAIFRYNKNHQEDLENQIRLVVPANEQGAGFMAAGYARATGKVGVFLVTSGPGATNCVTPIRDCMADSVPTILICGQVPRPAIGTDAFQEAPIFNIMSACAKHTFLVTKPEELEATFRTAFEIARSGRPGPVVIDVPKDVQNALMEYQGDGVLELRGFQKRMENLRAAKVSKKNQASFFQMLGESKRPLIYAGGGVINSAGAAEELRAFAKRFQIPVVTTLMGIGAYDTTDSLSLHMLGMHGAAYANYAVEDCDMLIAVGSRFDDRVAGKVLEFAPLARHIAHLDIDAAEIGKVKNIHWSHVGDAGAGLKMLREYGEQIDFKRDFSAWVQHAAELRANHAFNFDRESAMLQPYEVLEALNRITKGEAIVSTGVGQHQMWAAQYIDYKHPRSWLTSGSMGTMGFGLPAAIGAKIARPDKIVINVDGDGSIRMNIGELETATTYGANIKVLLLNNEGDGMVRQWQKLFFDERFSGTDKTMHTKDFVKAAEADGYRFAKRLELYDRENLEQVLQEFVAFDEGPAFLEVRIDPDACVFPMVGPGKGYKDMIVGPHITPRDAAAAQEAKGAEAADLF